MNFGLAFINLVLALLSSWPESGSAELSVASQWAGDVRNRTQVSRHRTCVENQQYLHQGLCCLNCQAGTYVEKACEGDLELGSCLACQHGQTYTEHSNGMSRCLPCIHCRNDQIKTKDCTVTTDTQCMCRSGYFCVPEQACEVCKKCAKCKTGEEEVAKCTSISNTVCRKRDPSPSLRPTDPPPSSSTSPETIAVPVVLVLLFLVIVLCVGVWFLKKRFCVSPCSQSQCDSSEIVKIPIGESAPTAEERQNCQNAGLEGKEVRSEFRPLLQETGQAGLSKASPPLEDEDRGLGDSLPNTTSSSQTSLSTMPINTTSSGSGNSPRPSPSTRPRLTPEVGDDPLQSKLVPLQGEETSLKASFDLFDKHLEVQIHNKFFRSIGVNDNHIRIAESAHPSDKVYELLKSWMQREGLKADINALLQALLTLDQRRSAESIAVEAIQRGFYRHADAPPTRPSGGALQKR
ncbi:tumor necrosis factor receptor superfamily, member a [Osmerus eperlanus]|uniref:tumor necrosis factor receptor superfamily, member a n=1 Tax=Osmerus eperlanus TaxID=29151 RepID=UPI002E116D1A